MRSLIFCALVGTACGLPPGRAVLPADSTAPDSAVEPRRPSRLDTLVVRTWNSDGERFARPSSTSIYRFLTLLLGPPDGRPVRDFHFGIVSSKIDMGEVCNTSNKVPNDGTLLVPEVTDSQPDPSLDWPASWSWPPRWPYLTGDMASSVDLPSLGRLYVVESDPIEGSCSVTQFLESALKAIDGRNPGFIRSDSLLLVWILADAEDCSTADATLWEPALWKNEYAAPLFRCYEPPAGLLHPIQRYVDGFSRLHPNGRILFAVTGRDEKPVWKSGSPKSAEVLCYGAHVHPAPRLGAFVRRINELHHPNQDARLMDPCVFIASDPPSWEAHGREVANRVLDALSR